MELGVYGVCYRGYYLILSYLLCHLELVCMFQMENLRSRSRGSRWTNIFEDEVRETFSRQL